MKKTLTHQILLSLAILAPTVPFSPAYSAQSADNKPKPAPMTAPAISLKPGVQALPAPKNPVTPAIAAPLLVSVTATTERPAANPVVTVAGSSWQCAASQCSRSAPATFVTAESCHALAQQVGRIRSFGSGANQLNAAQLTQCNQGIVTLVARAKTATTMAPASGGAITVETNYIAKAKSGAPMPSAGAPSAGATPITIETNYIARPKTGTPSARAGGGSSDTITVETNYIARAKTGAGPASAAATSGTDTTTIDVQVNYIARPKSR